MRSGRPTSPMKSVSPVSAARGSSPPSKTSSVMPSGVWPGVSRARSFTDGPSAISLPSPKGSEIALGPSVKLRALETPGHTPEGITLLVFDGGEEPRAALTGDTLFIGDVGRPDLMASEGATADGLAAQLYDSIHRKLLKLPDAVLVYPAHGAGSMCGRALSDERVSTIGEQRRTNPALQPMTREQ